MTRNGPATASQRRMHHVQEKLWPTIQWQCALLRLISESETLPALSVLTTRIPAPTKPKFVASQLFPLIHQKALS